MKINLLLIFIFKIFLIYANNNDIQLTTTNQNYMSVIAGFTARFQCEIYRCSWTSPTIAWYKDDVLIFNGTDFIATSGFEPENIVLQRTATPEYQTKDECVTEDYTLLIKNLSLDDAGKFRCQLLGFPQQLDFQLNVLESGLKSGFHENITYDHTECCIEHGMSPLCRAMCKPRDMHLDFFDPTSCKTNDYKNFLKCATDNGKNNYIPCCRQHSVPSFCFDFCSNNFRMLKKSHRLCLYYLPEIFECFSKPYSLYPESPKNSYVVNGSDGLSLCWTPNKSNQNVSYSIHVKNIPEMILHGDVSLVKSQNQNNINRSQRDTVIMISHESTINKKNDFDKISPEQIKKGRNNDLCILLNDLEPEKRYVTSIQASNSYGASEPSPPLFITTGKRTNYNNSIKH